MFSVTEFRFHHADMLSPSALSPPALSPMTLSDRLITLAKEADTAGYAVTAEHLVQLAITIFDEEPRRPD